MTNQNTHKIYRLCSLAEWELCQKTGILPYNQDDTQDGFFHLSRENQVKETALKYYMGTKDLYVLTISVDEIHNILQIEANKHGELFPHAYGLVPQSAVLSAKPVPLENGSYAFPKRLFA